MCFIDKFSLLQCSLQDDLLACETGLQFLWGFCRMCVIHVFVFRCKIWLVKQIFYKGDIYMTQRKIFIWESADEMTWFTTPQAQTWSFGLIVLNKMSQSQYEIFKWQRWKWWWKRWTNIYFCFSYIISQLINYKINRKM